jgi:hypothetical protein
MKSIGGFFSLELSHSTWGERYPKAIKLNSGRSCLEYILIARKYKKVCFHIIRVRLFYSLSRETA